MGGDIYDREREGEGQGVRRERERVWGEVEERGEGVERDAVYWAIVSSSNKRKSALDTPSYTFNY